MSINDLFSTPEQGRRLKELVPELTSAMLWASYNGREHFITDQRDITKGAYIEYGCTFAPALTLQELRDVANERHMHRRFRLMGAERLETWQDATASMTAPELAAWVIERLEATP